MPQINKNWFPDWKGTKPSQEFINLLDNFLPESFNYHFGESKDWDLIYPLIWPVQSKSVKAAPGDNREGVMLYSLILRLGNVLFQGIISWYSKSKPGLYQIDKTNFPDDLRVVLYDTFFDYEESETGISFNHESSTVPERMRVKKVDYNVSFPLLFQGGFHPDKSKDIGLFFVLNKDYENDEIKSRLAEAIKLSTDDKVLQKMLLRYFKHNNLKIESAERAYTYKLTVSKNLELPKFIKSLDRIGLPFKTMLFCQYILIPSSAKIPRGHGLPNLKAQEKFEWLGYVISVFHFGYIFSSTIDQQLRHQLKKLSGGNLKFDNNLRFGTGIEKSDLEKTIDQNERKVCTIDHYLSIGHGLPRIRLQFSWYSESADGFIDGQSEDIPDDLKFEIVKIENYTAFNEAIPKLFEKNPLVKWTLNTYFTIYREIRLDGNSGEIKLLMDRDIDPEEISEVFSEIVNSWNNKFDELGSPFFRYISFARKENKDLYFSYDAGNAIGANKYIMEELSKRIKCIKEVQWLN